MKKAITVFLTLFFIQATFPTALGDLVATMQPGTWKALQNNLTYDMFHGGPVMDVTYAFGANCHWDPVTEHLMFVGSPHASIAKFIIYDASANSWRQELTPREPQTSDTRIGHAYDMRTVDSKRGIYWVHSYVGHPLYRYYPAENRWDTVTTTGNWETANYNAMEYFPELDCIVSYYGRSGVVRKLSVNTLTWTGVGSIASAGYHAQMEYNPVHKVMIFGGGDNNVPLHQMDTAGNISQLTAPPVSVSLSVSEFTVDPVSGDLLLLTPTALHAFNMNTKQWQQVPFNPSAVGTFLAPISPHAMLFGAVSTYGCNVLLNTTTFNVLVYKHSAGSSAENRLPKHPAGNSLIASPNPFKPGTVISCGLNAGEKGRLSIFAANGTRVRSIEGSGNNPRVAWDGRDALGRPVAAGLYVAKLYTGAAATGTLRLVLAK